MPYELLRQECDVPDLDAYDVPSEARETFNHSMSEWIIAGAHGFWMTPDDCDGHCDPSSFVARIGMRLSTLCQLYNRRVTQSPIEDMMAGALLWLHVDGVEFPQVDLFDLNESVPGRWQEGDLQFYVTPQASIGRYAVDFLVWFADGDEVTGVAIECDGHAFHEKTKEQAAADKRRDREILAAGFPVVRFTGSEIYRDAAGCVEQVRGLLTPMLNRLVEGRR